MTYQVTSLASELAMKAIRFKDRETKISTTVERKTLKVVDVVVDVIKWMSKDCLLGIIRLVTKIIDNSLLSKILKYVIYVWKWFCYGFRILEIHYELKS